MMKNKSINIRINDQKWKVKITESHDPSLICDGTVCRGCTWCSNQTIYISNELTKATFLKVITHELVHASLTSTQMSIPESFTEEQMADFFALYGQRILKLAKELKEWALNDEVDSCV